MLRHFLITGEKGSVEDRVDLPFGGNAEAEHCSQDDFLNFKWAGPSHLKFLGSVHVKIGGFQPDLFSYFPWGVPGGYPFLHSLLGKLMGHLGIVTSLG